MRRSPIVLTATVAGTAGILAFHAHAPAVRTAVSRMVRQGWLLPAETAAGRGYALTERAVQRLDEAAGRIYRHRSEADWDGRWSVAIVDRSPSRTVRERLQRGLEYLGYRRLQGEAWIAPRQTSELGSIVRGEGLEADEFCAEYAGDDRRLVQRLYDIDGLASAYERWLRDARAISAAATPEPSPETAFAVRSRLVHEWRKFLFRDPGLPRALLPPDWPGVEAAAYFDQEAGRLLPAANAFVDDCLLRREP